MLDHWMSLDEDEKKAQWDEWKMDSKEFEWKIVKLKEEIKATRHPAERERLHERLKKLI